jgi:hypothetical protein
MAQNELRFRNKGSWLLILILLLLGSGWASTRQHEQTDQLAAKLRTEVKTFDNHGEPLISTLLRIAADYRVPMGIERVVKEAIERPIKVKIEQGTLADLLDLCMRQSPGYAWAARDGVVHVYGVEDWKRPSNLFNLVISSFEAQNETIGSIDLKLYMALIREREGPVGIAGVYSENPELERKRLSIKVQRATVREILNRMVALHGDVVWIARVFPERLSRVPQGGLWLLLPMSQLGQPQVRSPEYLKTLLRLSHR